MPSFLEMAVARANTPRNTRTAKKSLSEPRKPSKTASFLDWLREQIVSGDAYGIPFDLIDTARRWCNGDATVSPAIPAHYPQGVDGAAPRTPWATLSSTIGTAAEANELPPGFRLLAVDDVRALNRGRIAEGLPAWRECRSLVLMPADETDEQH